MFMSYDGGATPACVDEIQHSGHWTQVQLGLLGSLDKLGMTFSSVLWGRVLQLFPAKAVLTVGLAINAGSTLMFGLVHLRPAMYTAKLVMGITQGLQCVWATCWVLAWAPEDSKTVWLSLGALAAGLGNGLGTAIAGFGTAQGMPYAVAYEVQALALWLLWFGLVMAPPSRLALEEEDDLSPSNLANIAQNVLTSPNGRPRIGSSSLPMLYEPPVNLNIGSSSSPVLYEPPADGSLTFGPSANPVPTSPSKTAPKSALAKLDGTRPRWGLGSVTLSDPEVLDDEDREANRPRHASEDSVMLRSSQTSPLGALRPAPLGKPNLARMQTSPTLLDGSDSRRRRITRRQTMLNVTFDRHCQAATVMEPIRGNVGFGLAARPTIILTTQGSSAMEQVTNILGSAIFVWTALALASAMFMTSGIQFLWVRLFGGLWGLAKGSVVAAFLGVTGIGGLLGVVVGPTVIDSCGGFQDQPGRVKTLSLIVGAASITCLGAGVTAAGLELRLRSLEQGTAADGPDLALVLSLAGCFIIFAALNSTLAGLTGINVGSVPMQRRSLASGLTVSLQNMLGYALGPLLPGLVMDRLSQYDPSSMSAARALAGGLATAVLGAPVVLLCTTMALRSARAACPESPSKLTAPLVLNT